MSLLDKIVFVENTGRTNVYYRTIIAFECPEGFDYSLIHFNINESDKVSFDNLRTDLEKGVRKLFPAE